MAERQVKEFVIFPPEDRAEAILQARPRFLAHLAQHFPALTFIVKADCHLFEGPDFTVVPIIGRAGDETMPPDATYLCAPPAPELVHGIRRACETFEEDRRRLS